MNRSRISWILLFCCLALPLSAQTPLHVGWFDFEDERSQTTGLATHLAQQSNVRSHPFQLNVPSSFRPEYYDVIMIASFSEYHPSWDQFVRREKSRILEFVQRGGTLIQMCRHRKNDDAGRLSLLPSNFMVDRGKKDIKDDEWYVCYQNEPMWIGFGKDKNNGWNRLPQTKMGPRGLTCGMDAFTKWSRNLTRSADMNMRKRSKFPQSYALSGDLGKGRILLFQLILDKIDKTNDSLAQNQSREFFATLTKYLKSRRRVAQPEIKAKPEPKTEPIKVVPKATPPPTSYRLRGRVFYDANRNGILDRQEETAPNVTLRFDRGTSQSDSNGGYSIDVSNERSSQVFIDLPELADSKSTWFLNLNAGAAKERTVIRNIAILPRPNIPNADRRILLATIPKEDNPNPNRAALLELALSQAIADDQPELVVFLAPGQDARSLTTLRARLSQVAASNDVGFRLLAPLPANGADQVSRLHGSDRLVLKIGDSVLSLAAGRNADQWLRQSGSGVAKESSILISGNELTSNQTTNLTTLAKLLIVPQRSQDQSATDDGPQFAPFFTKEGENDRAAQYLLLTWAEGGLEVLIRPEEKEVVPTRPIHPMGRGDLDALFDEAGKTK